MTLKLQIRGTIGDSNLADDFIVVYDSSSYYFGLTDNGERAYMIQVLEPEFLISALESSETDKNFGVEYYVIGDNVSAKAYLKAFAKS